MSAKNPTGPLPNAPAWPCQESGTVVQRDGNRLSGKCRYNWGNILCIATIVMEAAPHRRRDVLAISSVTMLLHHAARSMTRSKWCWTYSKPHGAGLTVEFCVCAAGNWSRYSMRFVQLQPCRGRDIYVFEYTIDLY